MPRMLAHRFRDNVDWVLLGLVSLIALMGVVNAYSTGSSAGNPDLYGEMQVTNKYAQLTRCVLMEACRSLDVAFTAHDAKATREVFDKALALWRQPEAQAEYKRLYKRFEWEEKA